MLTDSKGKLRNVNRRDFVLKTALPIGFALAVSQVTFSVIETDLEGIEASEIKIKSGNIEIPAYQAMPKEKKNLTPLIICHEIFGVHEHIRDVCRRFAKLGYYAISPYLYARHGEVANIKDIPTIISEVVSKVTVAEVNADLDATVKYLHGTKKANMPRLIVTGFCWGGKATWMYAAHNPKIKCAIAWYGSLVNPPEQKSQSPIDIAQQLKVPVLGLYAGKDKNISLDHVAQMEKALAKGKSKSKIIIYPDVEHGFFADYRPSYQKSAAEQALSEMLQWIKKHP